MGEFPPMGSFLVFKSTKINKFGISRRTNSVQKKLWLQILANFHYKYLGVNLRLGWIDGRFGKYFLNPLVLNQDLEDYFSPFFSPMRNVSAKSLEMRAPFNNNLPMPTDDVIVNPRNPENPASKIVYSGQMVYWNLYGL